MISIGSLAPAFDCTAIVDGHAVQLGWDQLHHRQALVLLFDSVTDNSELLRELGDSPAASSQLADLQAQLCVVCREPRYELLTSAVPFPLIDDSSGEIASLYDMLRDDGTPLWGHCIIDVDGFVRRLVRCDIPAGSNLVELLRYLAAVGDTEFSESPC